MHDQGYEIPEEPDDGGNDEDHKCNEGDNDGNGYYLL